MNTPRNGRLLVRTGTKWEPIVGYSRAVRAGPGVMVFVAGTLAVDERGELVHPNDPYAQTAYIIRKIERALREAGAELRHVVRTRMFVADIDQWEEIARAHREAFAEIRPAATMVQISRLASTGAVIEIEADAVID